MDELEPAAPAPRAYTTYMTILARLHDKGLLTRRREGKTDVYAPVHTRERVRRPARAGRGRGARRRVRRRRARPLRPPGRRNSTPSAARRSSGSPVAADARARPWRSTGCSSRSARPASPARVLVLGAGARAVHVAPAAAHRLDVAGLRLTYPAVNAAAACCSASPLLGAAVLVVAVRAARRARPARTGGSCAALPGRRAAARPSGGARRSRRARRSRSAPAGCARACTSRRAAVDAALGGRAARRAGPRAPPPRAARPAAARRRPRALPGAVLPAGAAPAARPLRRRGRADARTRPRWTPPAAPAPLASAMLAFGAGPAGDVVGISPERVDSLLGRPRAWGCRGCCWSAGSRRSALLVALVWRASGERTRVRRR